MDQIIFQIMNPQTLGERIRQARENRKLTQKQLGAFVGKSESAVCQWESGGIREIKAPTMMRLAEVLRVSMDWLMSGEAEKPSTACGKVADYWPHLTQRQREQIERQVQELAEHNLDLISELGEK
jgi:transcriptional regulator with XRE-family HTH domain